MQKNRLATRPLNPPFFLFGFLNIQRNTILKVPLTNYPSSCQAHTDSCKPDYCDHASDHAFFLLVLGLFNFRTVFPSGPQMVHRVLFDRIGPVQNWKKYIYYEKLFLEIIICNFNIFENKLHSAVIHVDQFELVDNQRPYHTPKTSHTQSILADSSRMLQYQREVIVDHFFDVYQYNPPILTYTPQTLIVQYNVRITQTQTQTHT